MECVKHANCYDFKVVPSGRTGFTAGGRITVQPWDARSGWLTRVQETIVASTREGGTREIAYRETFANYAFSLEPIR